MNNHEERPDNDPRWQEFPPPCWVKDCPHSFPCPTHRTDGGPYNKDVAERKRTDDH